MGKSYFCRKIIKIQIFMSENQTFLSLLRGFSHTKPKFRNNRIIILKNLNFRIVSLKSMIHMSLMYAIKNKFHDKRNFLIKFYLMCLKSLFLARSLPLSRSSKSERDARGKEIKNEAFYFIEESLIKRMLMYDIEIRQQKIHSMRK